MLAEELGAKEMRVKHLGLHKELGWSCNEEASKEWIGTSVELEDWA